MMRYPRIIVVWSSVLHVSLSDLPVLPPTLSLTCRFTDFIQAKPARLMVGDKT